jgi:uncharacterized protein with FMN-binding domain
MRRITIAIMTTIAALVLLFSYRTSTAGPGGKPVIAGAAPPGVVGGDDPASPMAGAVAPSTASARNSPAAKRDVIVNGTAVNTRWGPVQVQAKISANRIIDVVVLMQPTGERRDREINDYALPILREQVLTAQSAQIDGVSGATVTSDGYRESLQAALDAAHFGS